MKRLRIRNPDAAWPRGRKGLRYQRWKSHPPRFINEKNMMSLLASGYLESVTTSPDRCCAEKGSLLTRRKEKGDCPPGSNLPGLWLEPWEDPSPQLPRKSLVAVGTGLFCSNKLPLWRCSQAQLLSPPHPRYGFSLLRVHVPSCSAVLILYDPMVCSPPGSSVHGDFPGKNTGVVCHFLLQGIFPTQRSNPSCLRWQADS